MDNNGDSLESKGFTLPESEQYLRETFPSYAQMKPQDRQAYLEEMHYGQKPPAQPAAVGREAALGVLGAFAPETQNPLQDIAKSQAEEYKNPLNALPGVQLAKTAYGMGKQLLGAAGEVAPLLGKLTPGGGMGSNITSDEAEKAAHGAGTIAGMALPLAEPALRGELAEGMTARQAIKVPETRASNLASALEMGGQAPKGVRTFEEVAKPILPEIRAEAVRSGVPGELPKGRQSYQAGEALTGRVRQMYDERYNSLVEPIRNNPAPRAAAEAADNLVQELGGQTELFSKLTNSGDYEKLHNLANEIREHPTVGGLDDLRRELNRISSTLEKKTPEAQSEAPMFRQALDSAADKIRESLYPAIGDAYHGSIGGDAIRELQQRHGAAIKADNLMHQTASEISRSASEEESPASLWQRFRGNTYRATMNPRHAAGGLIERLWPPSEVEKFRTRMGRALEGSTEGEGYPYAAPTVPPRIEGTQPGFPGVTEPPMGPLFEPISQTMPVSPFSRLARPALTEGGETIGRGRAPSPPIGPISQMVPHGRVFLGEGMPEMRPGVIPITAGSEPTPTGGARGYGSEALPKMPYLGRVWGEPGQFAEHGEIPIPVTPHERLLPPAGSIQVGPSTLPQAIVRRGDISFQPVAQVPPPPEPQTPPPVAPTGGGVPLEVPRKTSTPLRGAIAATRLPEPPVPPEPRVETPPVKQEAPVARPKAETETTAPKTEAAPLTEVQEPPKVTTPEAEKLKKSATIYRAMRSEAAERGDMEAYQEAEAKIAEKDRQLERIEGEKFLPAVEAEKPVEAAPAAAEAQSKAAETVKEEPARKAKTEKKS